MSTGDVGLGSPLIIYMPDQFSNQYQKYQDTSTTGLGNPTGTFAVYFLENSD